MPISMGRTKERLLEEGLRPITAEEMLFGHNEQDYEEYRTQHDTSGRDRVHP